MIIVVILLAKPARDYELLYNVLFTVLTSYCNKDKLLISYGIIVYLNLIWLLITANSVTTP